MTAEAKLIKGFSKARNPLISFVKDISGRPGGLPSSVLDWFVYFYLRQLHII